MARAISSSGFVTPVDVSLCVTSTAFTSGCSSSAWRTSSGRAACPHSYCSGITSAPYASAIAANRSPNDPMLTESTLSPGDSVFTIADSSPPVPDVLRTSTSLLVSKKSFSRSATREMSAANSRPRWFTIGCATASRMSGGTGVGPGMRRLGVRVMGVPSCYGERAPEARGQRDDRAGSRSRTRLPTRADAR